MRVACPAVTQLDGRVALVTGAGRGIGRAHALTLARQGVAVVVNDLGCGIDGQGADEDPAVRVVAEIEASGGQAIVDDTDIGSLAGGARAVQNTLDAYGRIDILVNNAGISGVPGQTDTEMVLDRQLAVHLKGTLGTMRAAIPPMKQAGWGRIVNTVSEVALDMRLGPAGAYGIAKAAVWSTTLATAKELRDTGITVNGISPSARTRMNDVLFSDGEPAHDISPDHVARVVAYLVTDEAADITGHIIHAAGGVVREYVVRRVKDTELVARLERALELVGG